MANNKTPQREIDLTRLMESFGSVDKCRAYLEQLRFPNGVTCTKCKSNKISRIYKRNQFVCDACKYQFSAMAGTIFHDTHLPLTKWFAAVYLMCESRKGISANQMSRTLKTSYKTAWYLCHRIRKAIETSPEMKLSGTIEVDESHIGGKSINMHADVRKRRIHGNKKRYGKTLALGALERDGNVVLRKSDSADREALHAFIRSTMSLEAQRIITDEWDAYDGIDATGVTHEKVNHKAKEYVRGDVHTNGIENVWSLFKRSIVGSFHHISDKHLDRYLDELEHRFNNRNNPFLFRDTLLRLIASPNIEYKELTKKVKAA